MNQEIYNQMLKTAAGNPLLKVMARLGITQKIPKPGSIPATGAAPWSNRQSRLGYPEGEAPPKVNYTTKQKSPIKGKPWERKDRSSLKPIKGL